MSPILTRPVREQFEHDRIIRLLQVRYRRKFEVAINIGPEQTTSVEVAEQVVFPDLVLFSQDRAHKLQGTVEVETGESVNTLEAMSQWALFSRLRVPFALYVPPSALDTARRLCVEYNIAVSEIWTYHTSIDQVRFAMVQQAPEPSAKGSKPAAAAPKPAAAAEPNPSSRTVSKIAPATKTAAATPAGAPAKPVKTAMPTKPAKPKAASAAAKPTGKAAKPMVKSAAKQAVKVAAKKSAKSASKVHKPAAARKPAPAAKRR